MQLNQRTMLVGKSDIRKPLTHPWADALKVNFGKRVINRFERNVDSPSQ
jgi:hypothetical protein